MLLQEDLGTSLTREEILNCIQDMNPILLDDDNKRK